MKDFNSLAMKLLNIYIVFLLCFTCSLFGQDETEVDNKDLEEEKVVVVSAYQPQLAKAEKIGIQASAKDIPSTDQSANENGLQGVNPYEVDPNFLELELEAPEMRAVALPKGNQTNTGLDEDSYYFWVKAGFGNNRTPMLNVSANTADRLENGVYGIDANFFSSNAGDAKALMQTGVALFGEQKTENFRFNADLFYDFDRYHYYGFNKDTFEFKSEEINIDYQNIGTKLIFDNHHQTLSNYEYEVAVGANYLFTNLDANEITADFSTGLFRRWQNGLKVGGDALISYTHNTDSLTRESDSFENTTASIIPRLAYQWAWGNLEIGASANFDNSELHVFPHAYVQLDAVRNVLGFYAGIDQKIIKNNLKSLSDENPFLNHTIPFDNTLKNSAYSGIKANISSFMSIDVRGVYEQIKYQHLFVNEIGDIFEDDKEFTVVYDPEMTAIGGEVELSIYVNKISQLSAKVSYRDFALEEQEKAWLLPNLTSQVKFLIKPIEKLKLTSDLFVYAGRYAYNPTKQAAVSRNPIIDINFSAEYELTENFGFFLNANNLALSKYQRFLYYQSYGLNFVGGIKARF